MTVKSPPLVHPKSNQLLIWVQEPQDAKLHEFYQVFSRLGDIQQIDFSYYSLCSVVLLTYFDVRVADHAKTMLEEISCLRVQLHTANLVTSRSLVISSMQLQKIEDIYGIASYGDIECIRNLDDGRVLVSFYDSRSAQKALADVDSLGGLGQHMPIGKAECRNLGTPGDEADFGMDFVFPRQDALHSPPRSDNSSQFRAASRLVTRMTENEKRSDGYDQAQGYCDFEDARHDAFFEPDLVGPYTKVAPGFMPSEYEIIPSRIMKGVEQRTTIMARHIPNSFTQQSLLALLHSEGFENQFDIFYLPIDKRNRCNVGYAFINMVCSAAVVDFYKKFHLRRWTKYNSAKICEVTFARIQGREALKEDLHRRQADVRRRPFWEQQNEAFDMPGSSSGPSSALKGPDSSVSRLCSTGHGMDFPSSDMDFPSSEPVSRDISNDIVSSISQDHSATADDIAFRMSNAEDLDVSCFFEADTIPNSY